MTTVIVSASPERRRDWARPFERDGGRALGCSGPLVHCPLVRDETRCALLDRADLAVYDLDSLTASFLPVLMRAYAHRTLLFARDTLTPGGQHQPSIRRFAAGGRGRGLCFGGY